MYIVQLTYRVPLETVDELRAAHYDHLASLAS